jgi:hypothetical protein
MEPLIDGDRYEIGLEVDVGDVVSKLPLEHAIVDAIGRVEAVAVDTAKSLEHLTPHIGASFKIGDRRCGKAVIVAMLPNRRGQERVFLEAQIPLFGQQLM